MESYTSLETTLLAPETHVIVRADFNVPVRKGVVSDDFKLRKTLPTIKYLLQKKCPVTLLSHFGRPHISNHYTFLPEYSLAPVAEWFQENGYDITLSAHVKKTYKTSLTLLENLRLWSGEKENNLLFAQELKQENTIFVHDAFGSIHNNDCSLTMLPTLFPLHKRYAGFLLNEELSFFDSFFKRAQKKCLLIVSGSKIDKLERLATLLSINNPVPDAVAIGGKLIEHFITEQPIAQKIRALCTQKNIELIIPIDGVFDDNTEQTITHENASHIVDLGSQSTQIICERIGHASHIIANCVVGKKHTATQKIIIALAQSQAVTAITGGESAQAAHQSGCASKINFISTGGGAVLALMAHPNNFQELSSLRILSEEQL